jgi:hypothetical protein
MNTQTPEITISPYLRIALAGFDIDVRTSKNTFRVILLRGEEKIAMTVASRSSGLTVAEATRRAKLNIWGACSQFSIALTRFAEIAESLSSTKQQ